MIETDEQNPLPMTTMRSAAFADRQEDRKIIVALDGSDSSQNAFDWAVRHLVKPDDVLMLTTVIEPTAISDVFYSDVVGGTHELQDKMATMATTMMHEWTKRLSEINASLSNVKVMVTIRIGEPRDVLCEMSGHANITALVVGNRGLGRLKRMILGSTSNYLLHHAKTAVVVIKS